MAHDDVDDLAQRTLLAGLEAGDRLQQPASVAYLLGIARNQILKYIERRNRDTQGIAALGCCVTESSAWPSHRLEREDECRPMREALRALPLAFRSTVELVYWHDMTGTEAAAALAVAPGTVRSRLARAKALLRIAIHDTATMKAPRREKALDAFFASSEPFPASLVIGDP